MTAASPRQPPADGAPTVVYIAGSGRSGSTLLERALGEIPGYVSVGELIDLFRREASRGRRCGCGRPFADCPFWASVAERAFGGWAGPCPADLPALQRRVAKQRYLPRLAAMRLAGHGFREDTARYGTCYARLYRAIAAEAGAACVVDASKWPVQALALARGGIDVRVIHLVRDVRGVAHSLSRRARRPAATAVRWVLHQAEAWLVRRCGLPFTSVRYEDFVRQPRQTVETALAGLGLSVRLPAPGRLGDGLMVLGPGHGIHGNPMRFRYGEIPLSHDETWREQMPRRDRILVTAIGLPFLLRYRGRRRGGPGAAAPLSAVRR